MRVRSHACTLPGGRGREAPARPVAQDLTGGRSSRRALAPWGRGGAPARTPPFACVCGVRDHRGAFKSAGTSPSLCSWAVPQVISRTAPPGVVRAGDATLAQRPPCPHPGRRQPPQPGCRLEPALVRHGPRSQGSVAVECRGRRAVPAARRWAYALLLSNTDYWSPRPLPGVRRRARAWGGACGS